MEPLALLLIFLSAGLVLFLLDLFLAGGAGMMGMMDGTAMTPALATSASDRCKCDEQSHWASHPPGITDHPGSAGVWCVFPMKGV